MSDRTAGATEPSDETVVATGMFVSVAEDFDRFYLREYPRMVALAYALSGNRWAAVAIEFPGPFAVIIGDVADDDWESIASIVARYSGGKNESMVDVRFVCGDDVKVVGAAPATTNFLDDRRV